VRSPRWSTTLFPLYRVRKRITGVLPHSIKGAVAIILFRLVFGGIFPVHAGWIPLGFWVTLVTLNCAELHRVELSSGDLSVLPTVALNFENLVAKVLPVTISSAAMVKEKGG
jgi:hypothetical protein